MPFLCNRLPFDMPKVMSFIVKSDANVSAFLHTNRHSHATGTLNAPASEFQNPLLVPQATSCSAEYLVGPLFLLTPGGTTSSAIRPSLPPAGSWIALLPPPRSRARSPADRREPSAAPQPGSLPALASLPPGAAKRTRHLLAAAEPLHGASAGGHGVAQ